MKTFTSGITFIIAMAAAMSAVSCQKDDRTTATEQVEVSLNVCTELKTKALLNEENENVVKSIEFFVFKADGDRGLEVYGKTDSPESFTLKCTPGAKTFYAVVNGNMTQSQLRTIAKCDDLLKVTSELVNNELDCFEMIGSKDQSITGNDRIEIEVKRLVARVGIKNIKVEFNAPHLKNAAFKIKRIYMVNVAAVTNFGFTRTLTADDFVNFKHYQESLPDFTGVLKAQTVENNHEASMNEYFYVYPNNVTTDVHDASDSPRKTRLVVEATINDVTYYYPVTIEGENGKIDSNKAYTIGTLTVTREGSLSPDEPLQFNAASFGIHISDWTETTDDKNI